MWERNGLPVQEHGAGGKKIIGSAAGVVYAPGVE